MPDCLPTIEALLARTSRALALVGGLILLAMTLLTVLSVAGRSVLGRPIPGDFELIEVGAAMAVFLFLPDCQMRRRNLVVDLFTARWPPPVRARLDALGSLLFAAIAAILTWRMSLGGLELYRYQEQTMILGLARWWGFVPIVVASALLTAVCLFSAVRSLRESRQ